MNRLTTRREKMKKRLGSLRCCLTVFLKVAVLMLTCFEEISGIVVITPAPIRLLNDTEGENCSGLLDGLPRVSVAPDSINYIGTYPRPWINRTHEVFVTSSAEPQHANVSDLSTERDVLFTENPDFLNQTKQNQTLSTSHEDPTTIAFNTHEDKSVTESPLISSFSKLNRTSISAKPESDRITPIANTFKTDETPYLQTSIPNLKLNSSKTFDTSYRPSMITQTFTIKQTFPMKRHTSSVHGKIKMLNQTRLLNSKKSHKLTSKAIDTPSKNSLLTNIIPHENSPKNYGTLNKYSALPSNSNLLLSEKKSSVSNRPTEKHTTLKRSEMNRDHSSKNSTENSITTSGTVESLTVTSIFNIISDFTSAFFSEKIEKPLNKIANLNLAKQSPELLNSVKQISTHSEPLNSSEKLNIPSHKNLYTFEQLNTPPSELSNSLEQLSIPSPQSLHSLEQLSIPSPQSLHSLEQLSMPSSPQSLHSLEQLSTSSPQSLYSPEQSTPSPQSLYSSEQLSTPSPQSLNSSEQLIIPSYASITKAEPIDLRSLEKELNSVLASRLPLALDPDLLYLWRAPYLQRLRHSNHEMVDVILQSDVRTPPESSECPNEYQKIVLLNLQRMLGLLLLTLPQSLKEVEEVIWDPELENYLFRPQGKAILDVTTCKGSCYIMDSLGNCREIFSCKDGTTPGLAPRLTPEQLNRLIAARTG